MQLRVKLEKASIQISVTAIWHIQVKDRKRHTPRLFKVPGTSKD